MARAARTAFRQLVTKPGYREVAATLGRRNATGLSKALNPLDGRADPKS